MPLGKLTTTVPPATDRLSERKAIVFLGLWTGVLNACATGVLSPALPSIAHSIGRGVDAAFVAQNIQTVSALGMIAGAGLAGLASERLGRRAVMAGSALLFVITGVAGLWLTSVPWLLVARALTGFASGVMMTSSYALVGENFHGRARHRMIGFCGGAGAFATIVLLTLAGWMVDAFGWRSVFALYALGLPMIPIALRAIYRGVSPYVATQRLNWGPIVAMWPLWLMQAIFAIGVYMSVIQVPFIAADRGIGQAATIGLLVSATSVSGTAVAVGFGWLRRLLGEWGMFVLISGSFALGMWLCVVAQSLPVFLAGTITLGVGAGSLEPAIMARVLDRLPQPLHDRAAGAAISTLFLGQFLNPLAVHPLAEIGGISFAVMVFAWIFVAAMVLSIVLLLASPKRQSTASEARS